MFFPCDLSVGIVFYRVVSHLLWDKRSVESLVSKGKKLLLYNRGDLERVEFTDNEDFLDLDFV